jgi:hypothetical protein
VARAGANGPALAAALQRALAADAARLPAPLVRAAAAHLDRLRAAGRAAALT